MSDLMCVVIGVGLLFGVPVLIGVGIYNSLVRLRAMVRRIVVRHRYRTQTPL